MACTSPPPSLRFGANVWPGVEPIYLARSLGYYQGQSIELIDFPSSTEVTRAYRAGLIDVASLTADEALTVADTLPDQRIVLVLDYSLGADAVVAKPRFASMEDLRGRRIAFEHDGAGAYVLARALEVSGMAPRDVTLVPMRLQDHQIAYDRDEVDAVVTFEPRLSDLVRRGARPVFTSKQIPGEILDVLLTRAQFIEQNSPQIRALIGGWFRALDYLRQQPSDAARRIAGREGVAPEAYLASLRGIELVGRPASERALGRSPDNLEAVLRRTHEVMRANRLLLHMPELSSILDDRFVRTEAP